MSHTLDVWDILVFLWGADGSRKERKGWRRVTQSLFTAKHSWLEYLSS